MVRIWPSRSFNYIVISDITLFLIVLLLIHVYFARVDDDDDDDDDTLPSPFLLYFL